MSDEIIVPLNNYTRLAYDTTTSELCIEIFALIDNKWMMSELLEFGGRLGSFDEFVDAVNRLRNLLVLK